MADQTESKWLTVKEAATYVGVSERFMRRLMEERKIPFHKHGEFQASPVRIAQDDLDRYLSTTRVEVAQ